MRNMGESGILNTTIQNKKVPDADGKPLQVRIIGNRVRIPDDPVAVYAEHFFTPMGSHCENGKTKKCGEAKVRRPAFLWGRIYPPGISVILIRTAMDRHL